MSLRTLRLARRLLDVAVIVFMLAGAALLWPQALGGRVSYVMVSGESMEPRLRDGDLVLVRVAAHYEVGDAVAYEIPAGDPGAGSRVIHRIVGGNERAGFVTRGDNRGGEDLWRPVDGDVIGEQWVRVPGAAGLLAKARSPLPLAFLAALATVVMFLPRRQRRPASAT